MSLRTRIATVAGSLVLAAILVNSLLQTLAARRAVLDQVRVGGESIAEVLSRAVTTVELAPELTDDTTRLTRSSGLERLLAELVGDDIRELRVLDPQLATVAERRAGDMPAASLGQREVELARDAIANGRPATAFDAGSCRVAAPVRRTDGQLAGAVLVAISTSASRDVLWWQAAAAAAAAALVGIPGIVAAAWIARSIARPVSRALAVAESIAAGDLTGRLDGDGRHEVGRLLSAFGAMIRSLGGLIGRIKTAGGRLTSLESEAATALARQNRAVRGVSGSAHEISAAVTEISTTSEQLLAAMTTVKDVAREAASVAAEGRGGLDSMTASMERLDAAMNAFTRKLATISQRAGGITAVVTTISKVAEQTNLLSVNATIEAEKAGESGRGFRIVAQEIRRLADQTALATKDIERMVRDMQAAVASGTMEMDRFRNEVSGRIADVAEVSEKLGRIIDPVQAVTRSLDQVHDGMESQSQGARQIRDAMEKLREDAGESAASLASFSASLDELRRSIGELNAEAARFRT